MLLNEVQRYNCNCKQKTGCQCLSIVSSEAERLSIASTIISRQYIQCKRRRKKNKIKLLNIKRHIKSAKKFNTNFSNCRNKIDKEKRSCCSNCYNKNINNRMLNDQISYCSFFQKNSNKEEKKHQTENQNRGTIFSSSINQSCLNCSIYMNFKTPSISCKFKLNHLSKNKSRFKFNLIQFLIFIIGPLNFVIANQLNPIKTINSFSNSINLFNSKSTISSNISSINITNLTTTKNLNSTLSYSTSLFNYKENLSPTTKYYKSLSNHEIDKLTTRSPNYSDKNRFNNSFLEHNQTKSAHYKKLNNNAFHYQLNSSLDNSEFKNNSYIFNWTDRFKKAINNTINSAYSTVSANKNYDDLFSNSIPTPSSLIFNQSNLIENNKTIQNSTISEDYIDNLNITNNDDNNSFASNYLQPFINLSWWTKVPFPKSGYHNYAIVLLAFFLSIVMMIVVIGNLLVCIAICTEKNLKTIQNWFIASLAISDLLLGLIIMPFSLAYELLGTWVFSDLWCDFHHALDVLLTTASINNLCLISLDRYWSVTQAIEYLKKRTPCRAIFMIVFAWVFSALVCLPPLFGWKKEDQQPGECLLSNDIGYVLYSSLGSFFIPAVVMVFVYARIFVAARSRARKHVRKKQVSSSVLEQKKSSQSAKPTSQQPPASTSSQDAPAVYKQHVTPTVSLNTNQEDKKEETDLQKSEQKGSTKQTNRVPYGRFARRAQDQELDQENGELAKDQSKDQQQELAVTTNKQEVNLQISSQSAESNSGSGTVDSHKISSVPTSGSSVQTEPATADAKAANFARSTSAFTYDHLFVEDRKSVPTCSTESIGRPATPSSKVTFSPNDVIFDLNANGTQSVSLVPQIVIHGSMQQLHLQSNVKRARFSVNKLKDSDFNNNQNQTEKRFGHPTITATLSAGQLDCVILDGQKENESQKTNEPLEESQQPKRSSIKRTKYQNDLEIDCKAAQQLNYQYSVNASPHSILKATTSSQSSPTALIKSQQQGEQQQIELQEKSSTTIAQHLPAKPQESNLSKDSKEAGNHISPVSRTFSEQTANSLKLNQVADGKLNYLGVNSLQSAASISGSMMSINYDDDSECYIDEKSSKRGFEDDEFDFEDENESSNTHDENASKRSVKGGLRQSKKRTLFSRWPWCKKWLWLNEKCASNQEEEFAGYEDDEEEEDEEFDELGRSSLRSGGDQTRKQASGHKRILRKNKSNKSYNASIISANNTSSSGTHGSTTGHQQKEKKPIEKKSNSLFSRFSRDNSNKSTSSGSAKRTASSGKKERSSAKSSCSVSAISQTGSKQRKNRHKSGQLHAHSSSTAHSESGVASQYRFQASEADRQRRRIAKAREKRATLILGLIMGAFILGYIPFSFLYLFQGICPHCNVQSALTVTYWIGYTASAINPIIYTVFNRDFRKAFRKILFR